MRSPSSCPRRTPRAAAFALVLALVGCAGAPQADARLPFHVAVAPPVAVADAALAQRQGNATALAFEVDEERLARALETALARTFNKVSRLPAAEGDAAAAGTAWLRHAQARGADLVLQASLRYQPEVRTELNDRFWLNLPLFAIGGPFNWFVADRSYRCHARLDGQLFDVAVATTAEKPQLEPRNRVLRVDRETTEAALNFLDRADGPGAYFLSLVCPSGLLARESDAVPAELDACVVQDLCDAMAQALRDRGLEITESDLVDFHPRSVQVREQDGGRVLAGEMVLGLTQANELGGLRYRIDDGAFAEASWTSEEMVSSGDAGRTRRIYGFAIPLGPTARNVQLEVEQMDRTATRRTFTFEVE